MVALEYVAQLMFLVISLFILMTKLLELNDVQYNAALLLFEEETGLSFLTLTVV